METKDTEVTKRLAEWVAGADRDAVPQSARQAGVKTLLNWMGCAVGGSQHEAVEIALRALGPFMGPREATLLGRGERVDPLSAALLNGLSSHVHDFDDTHLKTIIHPAGPVASAILSLAEHIPVTGAAFLHALILGVEVECRIGNAVYPSHYDVGWHITGTTGVFGAAAAAGRLLGLTTERMCWALGTAGTQASGLREMFGSMCKGFHVGRAAQNGLSAALLAAEGFTSSERAIEAPRGFANVLATERNYSEIDQGLGEHYEIELNTYKPFPCGIVIHPAIDGCLQLRGEHRFRAEEVAAVELRVHPLVLELTGKRDPSTGLEGKFSIYHAAAVALARGQAGMEAFSDGAVKDSAVVALRRRVTATADGSLGEDQAHISIRLEGKGKVELFIEHAIGSLERPMSDEAMEAKVHDLAGPVLGKDGVDAMIRTCRRVEELPAASELARSASG